MKVSIERVFAATPEVGQLVEELERTLAAWYGDNKAHGPTVEQMFEPNVWFFVAKLDDIAVGCGGLAMFPKYAEVKRMYTRPIARGRGIATALLRRIEEQARSVTLLLETGVFQPEAIRLYERHGFRPCEPYGEYSQAPAPSIKLKLFYAKPLVELAST